LVCFAVIHFVRTANGDCREVDLPHGMVRGVQGGDGWLGVPLGPDWINEINGQEETTNAQQHPQHALGPVPAILGDVAKAM